MIIVGAGVALYFLITFISLVGKFLFQINLILGVAQPPTALFKYQSGAGVADIIGRDIVAVVFFLLWRKSYSQERY